VTDQTSDTVRLRGIDFAYTSIGEGPLVLSAHGLSTSRAGNVRMGFPGLEPIAAAGYRVVAYDARGHGESSGSDDPADYVWARLADDMLALADRFSPENPIVGMGASMGTGTLLHAATRHPERFGRLILTAPPTAWATRAAQADGYRAMADLVEASGIDAFASMFDAAPVPPVFVGVPGFPPLPDIRAELLPTVFRGAALADLPPLETIATLAQPALILAWSGDPGHPLSTAEALEGALPDARLHVSDTHDDLLTWSQRAADFLGAA
jgi:pimeloyl-ACP methyl ester carboxylesterase